jgi:FlgN protein/Phycobilisome protein
MHDQNRLMPAGQDEELARKLSELIAGLTQAYESLDAQADLRRRAITSADMHALAQCIRDENETVQRVALLDESRESIVRDAMQGSAEDSADLTISQLASLLAQPWRDPLLDASRRLRALISSVQQKNASARQAAEKLARHMQGLLRAAEGWHSQTGSYERSGAVRAGAPVITALDCTT